MVELLSENAACIFGLAPAKGSLRVGADADIVVVDLDNEFTVDNKELLTQSRDTTPMYNGFKLIGRPIHTIVRGRTILRDRKIDDSAQGWGKCLKPDWTKKGAW
jgi:dihydroorotase-like cyclic amidohydrolase